MKKMSIPILLSSFILFGLFFSTGYQKDVVAAKAEPETPTATFVGFAGGWNPATHSGTNERYILNFAEDFGENNTVNYCEEIGDHFQINGESLKSISTSLRIGHNNQGANRLFIDVPTAKIVPTEDYPVPVFHIDEGTPFQNYLLPELTFFVNPNTYTMMQSSTLVYSGFNNNTDFTNPHPDGVEGAHAAAPTNGAMVRILFNENILGDDNAANYEDHTSQWGNNVTMNGVRLSTIGGALVGASFGRLYIFVPTAAMELTNYDYYLIPTLHIRRAYFGICVVPEMTFRFTGTIGVTESWTKYEPEEANVVPEDKYLTTNNYVDLFTDDTEIGKEKEKLVGQVPLYTNETNFAFEFKNDSKEGSLTLYTFSNDDYSGIRLTIDLKNNTISLLDTSKGALLDALAHPLRNNEWYRIYFGIKFNDDDTIDYSLAIDDVIYLTGDDALIGSKEYFGRKMAIYSGIGVTSFSNPRPGSDIKKPFVTYLGEDSYRYNVGSIKPDLKALCTSYDEVDGDVSGLIEVNWPEGSLTGDNLNKGNWTITITLSDNSGNFDVLYIHIIVSDSNEVLVTFDGQNPTYYAIGSLIEKPEDPVKKEDKFATYTFIGWFNGETQWDFANDHVTEDLNLIAKFQKIERKYAISLVIENNTTTLELPYGAKIDLTTYKKDGYLMTVTCDGVKYVQDIYEVRGEATITITYQKIDDPINPINPTNNSNKDLTGLFIGLACGGAVLIIGAEVLVLMLKKKGNKKKD